MRQPEKLRVAARSIANAFERSVGRVVIEPFTPDTTVITDGQIAVASIQYTRGIIKVRVASREGKLKVVWIGDVPTAVEADDIVYEVLSELL